MTDQKNPQTNDAELNDQQLTDVNGGIGFGPTITPYTHDKIYITDYSYCGEENRITHQLTYRPCTDCGRPLHTQTWNPAWSCNNCDNVELIPSVKIWYGSREQLISDAL